MNAHAKLVLATLGTVAALAPLPSGAATLTPEWSDAHQQMLQSMTQKGENTSGARATSRQQAHDVAVSRQIPPPTLAQRRADVLAAAVYPQAGPSTAAKGAKNAKMSRRISSPTVAERRTDVINSAVYPQSGPSMAAMAAKNAEMSRNITN